MTAAELDAFVANVRAQATAALACLDTVDPDSLPPDLRAEYDDQRANWLSLLAMTEGDALELHQAGGEHAGRELTPAEARTLLLRH